MKSVEAEKTAKQLVKSWLIEDCHEKPHIAETMSGCMKLVKRIYDVLKDKESNDK